jgi:hypothetical protein
VGNQSITLAEQLETAHFNNTLLRREIDTIGNAQNIAIQALIRCQGLLAQFFRPDVRIAFEGGFFDGLYHKPDMLSSVDLIKGFVLPFPTSVGTNAPADGQAMGFVTKLLARDPSEPVDASGNPLPYRQSFAAWRNFFRELAGHRAWEILPMVYPDPVGGVNAKTKSNRCASDRVEVKDDAPTSHYPFLSPIPPFQSTSSPKGKVEPKLENQNGCRKKKSKKKAPATVYKDSSVESSSGDSSSSSGDDCAAPDVNPEAAAAGDGSIVEILRNIQFPKEVVPPTTFDPSLSGSMKKFMTSFDRYFSARYHGSEKEKSLQLGRFLKGTAKQAYDAIGGGQVKYRNMKRKLLEWYQSERTSRKSVRRDEFHQSMMRPDETCTIYCLRLEKLAEQAFADDFKERERNLCKKFRETAPKMLLTQIENAQGLITAYSDAKVTWKVIKSFSETYDRQSKQRKLRGTATDGPEDEEVAMYFSNFTPKQPTRTPQQASPPKGQTGRPFRTQVYRNGQSGGSPGKSRFSPRRLQGACNYCGRTGHGDATCWLKQGACLSCGDKTHFSRSCPKRRGQVSGELTMRCSECGGPHLGKDCLNSGNGRGESKPLNPTALSFEGATQSLQRNAH